MDIIGPLPESRFRKRYVLVICDCATLYPEAIPLRYIDGNMEGNQKGGGLSKCSVVSYSVHRR